MTQQTPAHPEPTDAQATLDKAMQRHQQGDLYEADLLYAQTLRLDPSNNQALRLRAILARERGEIEQSLQLLQTAHDANTASPEPLGEMALTYMAAGKLTKAEECFKQALVIDPSAIRILTNYGALLQHRGHTSAAIDCYRHALAVDAEDVEVRCNLAKALADMGQTDEALKECDVAIKLSDSHPFVLATRGAVLTDSKRYDDARKTLEESTRVEPYNDMALVNLALCYYELDDIKTAAQVLQQAVNANPWNARAVADLANCFSALSDSNAALDLCESFLRQNPGERLVVAAYALALHNAGRNSEALELTNCDSLLRVYDLPCPAGFTSSTEFNTALGDALRTDQSLLANPISKSTFGGAQTGELDLHNNNAIEQLSQQFAEAIQDACNSYLKTGLENHPLMAPATDDWSLRVWGSILATGGQQTPHMHPVGWISGVYYVSLPEDMDSSNSEAGWLEIGRPPERFFRATETATRRFEPKESRLILFPSWFWHQTIPFDAHSDRISIAFDVVPRAMLSIL